VHDALRPSGRGSSGLALAPAGARLYERACGSFLPRIRDVRLAVLLRDEDLDREVTRGQNQGCSRRAPLRKISATRRGVLCVSGTNTRSGGMNQVGRSRERGSLGTPAAAARTDSRAGRGHGPPPLEVGGRRRRSLPGIRAARVRAASRPARRVQVPVMVLRHAPLDPSIPPAPAGDGEPRGGLAERRRAGGRGRIEVGGGSRARPSGGTGPGWTGAGPARGG